MTSTRALTTAGLAQKLELKLAPKRGATPAWMLALLWAPPLALSALPALGAPAIQVQDDRGRAIALQAPARRAVTLAPHRCVPVERHGAVCRQVAHGQRPGQPVRQGAGCLRTVQHQSGLQVHAQ
ncbi:MAG: hypothetical protein ACTHLV_08025, partial [Achromobacter mucicolens]